MKKKYIKIFGIIFGILVLAVITGNFIVKSKIETALKTLPKNTELSYEDLDVNILMGNVNLRGVNFQKTGNTTNKKLVNVEIEAIKIRDLGYYNMLVNDEIHLKSIKVNNARVTLAYNDKVKTKDAENNFLSKLKQAVYIDKIEMVKSKITINSVETDLLVLQTENFNFLLNDFKLKPTNTENSYNYKDVELSTSNLIFHTNLYEILKIKNVKLADNSLDLDTLSLKTKYSISEYNQFLIKERDHFNLELNTINISDFSFGLKNNLPFQLVGSIVSINNPQLHIYRDKRLADDLTPKKLYSKMLRELKTNVGFNKVNINNAKLSYTEKVNSDVGAGKIEFKNMNTSVINLKNFNNTSDTKISVNTIFMDKSPLKVDWSCNIQDSTDLFVFKADLGRINAQQLNQFTKPNLKVGLEGELEQTYFTISGNSFRSQVDLKVKYDDFKVTLLEDNLRAPKKLLTGILNLFIASDSKADENGYRYGYKDDVERDQTKSVFNFVYKNTSAGLLSAMAGDGEREKNN